MVNGLPAFSPLIPPVLLALAALAAWMAPRAIGRWVQPAAWAAPALAAFALAAAATGAVALAGAPNQPFRFALSTWTPGLFPGSPSLDVGLLAAACMVLVALLGVAVALRGLGERSLGQIAAPLAVAAAAALFIASARSPLGLVFSWLLLDLAIGFTASGGRGALLAGHFGLLLALAGLIGLPLESPRLGGGGIELTETRRALLTAACLIRVGGWPVWWAVPRSREGMAWRAIGIRLAPTVAGLYLAMIVGEMAGFAAGMSLVTVAPGLLALFFGGLLGIAAPGRASFLDWRTTAWAGLVLLAVGLSDPVGRTIAFVLLVHVVLVSAAAYGFEGLRFGAGGPTTAKRAALAFSAAALPPTLGFAGRWLLFDQLVVRSAIGVLVLAFLGTVLISAPLRRGWRVPPKAHGYAAPLFVGFMLLLGLELVLGVRLDRFGTFLRGAVGGDVPSPVLLLLNTPWLRAPAHVVAALAIPVLLILAAPPLGWAARKVEARNRGRPFVRRGRGVLRLAGAAETVQGAIVRLGAIIQRRSGLTGGRRAMALTLLAAIVISGSMFGLGGPGSPPRSPAETIWPEAGLLSQVWFAGLAPLILAGALSGVILLVRAPAAKLIALHGAYALSGVLVAQGGAPAVLGALMFLVGTIVVGMLAISVMQAPIDRRMLAAARRLRALRPGPDAERSPVVPGLALLVALAAARGFDSVVLAERGVSMTGVLHPTVAMAAGGVLTVVFAVAALDIAVGVVLAVVGAQLLYTVLDPGLLIGGTLAGFHLLLAVVASFFIGLSALSPGDVDLVGRPTGGAGGGVDAEREPSAGEPEIVG